MLVNGEKVHIIDNDIDNDRFLKKPSMSMNRVSKAKLCSDREAESGAERFVKTLSAPECKQFFLKVMYHLPYETRERLLAAATRPGIISSKKYFTHCAKRALANLGY